MLRSQPAQAVPLCQPVLPQLRLDWAAVPVQRVRKAKASRSVTQRVPWPTLCSALITLTLWPASLLCACHAAALRNRVEPVVMSAGELEHEWAGTPGRMIRERYRTASEVARIRGKMGCLLINDIDAGGWGGWVWGGDLEHAWCQDGGGRCGGAAAPTAR